MYPLNGATKGRDISMSKSPRAKLRFIRFVRGPDGTRDGAARLYGRPGSYILFPNEGKLVAQKSMTILLWVYPEGPKGPIFMYKTGTGIRMAGPRKISVRFRPLRRRILPRALKGYVKPRTWQFVVASYDYDTATAKLWLNGKKVDQKKIGKFLLATDKNVKAGFISNRRGYFKGRLACIQIFSKALKRREIVNWAKRCFRSK